MTLRPAYLRSRFAGVALLALAGLTCRDRSLTGPGLTAPAKLRVTPSVAAAPFGPLFTLGSVRVTLTPYPGTGEPVINRVATFTPGETELSLDLTVQLSEASERFVLRVAAADAQAPHDTIFRSVDTVTVTAGSDEPTPRPVALVYDGRDKDVASITVEPVDTTFRTTDNVPLRVVARRADGSVVDPAIVRFGYTVGDEANAQVSATGVISARAPGVGFANMLVTVGTGNGVTGTTRITGRVPVVAVEITSAGGVIEPITGTTLQLTGTVRGPTNVVLGDRPITWGTTNPARATVSSTGLVTAGPDTGEVFITAVAEGVTAPQFRLRVRPVPVATVRIILPSPLPAFEVGDTIALSAVTEAANGQPLPGRPVTWSTTTPTLVRVLDDGRVIALAPGAAQVTATAEGITGSAALTVVQAAVASLTLTPDSVGVVRGGTFATTVSLVDKRGNAITGRAVAYRFTRPNVASVTTAGVVTGLVADDTTSLIAEAEGKADTVRVYVLRRALATLTVQPLTAGLVVGETVTIVATALDAQGQPNPDFPVTFQSLNPNVATVNATTGVVTAVAPGTATIRASAGGLTADATVTVGLRATGVRITPREPRVLTSLGEEVTLTAQAFAGDVVVPDARFTWESRDAAVATVSFSESGESVIVTARGNGTVRIVATLVSDPTQKDSVSVLVQQQVAALTITPATAERYLGTFLDYTAAALDARQQPVPAAVAAPQIAWSTLSGGQIVSVDANGRATMRALGSDSVIASVGITNARAAAFVTVVASIRRIAVGTTPTTAPALGTRIVATAAAFDTLDAAMTGVTFTWATDNPQVLRFDSVGTADGAGYFTTLANGTARVIATAQGQQGSATVSVAQQLAQIRLDPANGLVVAVGGTGVAAASYFDANGQPMNLIQQPIFSIRNEQPAVPGTTVARVDPSTGVVTGVAAGSAEVVATLNGITSNAVRVQVSGMAVVFGVPQVQVGTRTTVQVPVMLTGAAGAPVTLLVRARDQGIVELQGNAGGGQGGVGLLFPRGSTQQMLTVTGVAAGTTQLIAQEAVCTDGCAPAPNPTIAPDTVDVLVASAIAIDRPIHVARGDSTFARLILQDPAPQGGLTVGFTFSTPGIVDVVAVRVPPTLPAGQPNVVTIPAGLLAVDIYVRGLVNGVTQITPVPQGSTTPGFAQTAVVTQGQLFLYGFNDYLTGDTVFVIGEGQHNSIYTESSVMTSSAPGDSLRVALTSADPRIATTAEPVVVVPPGLDYAIFNLRGLARGRTTLTAAAQGSDVWQPATRAVRVTTPYLQLNDFSAPDQTVLVGAANHLLGVFVSDSLGTPHARISPLAVRLRVENVSPAGGAPIVALDSADLTLRSGNLFYTSYTGVRFLAPGTVRIIAEAPGEPVHRPDTVTYTIVAGKLEFAAPDADGFPQPVPSVSLPVGQVYQGLVVRAPQGVSQLPTLAVRRLPNAAGGPFASPESPGTTLGSPSSTVNVIGITGLALGAERYEVSAPGFEPDTITVNVVRGRLTTEGLPDSVQVGERDSFSLSTETEFRVAANVSVTVTSSGQGLTITGSPTTIAAGDRSASPSPGIVANAAGTYQITFTPDNPNYDPLVRTVVVIAPKLIAYVRGEGRGNRVSADTIGLGQMTSSTGDPTLGVRVPFDLLTTNVDVRVRSLDPEVALVGPGVTNDTTVTICPSCNEPEAHYVVRARARGTARIELSATGYEPDTIRVVVASGRFTSNLHDPSDPTDDIPDELVVGERGWVSLYLTDSLSLAAALVTGDLYYGAVHDADSVTLRLSSSNPEVLQVASQYVRVPRGTATLTMQEVLIAAGAGTATFTIEDSATHASPALARYAPLATAVTVLGRALEVSGDERALGMRQRFGFVDPGNGAFFGGLHVCRGSTGWGGTTSPLRVRISSSEPRVAAVAPGFEVVTIAANNTCAAYDVIGQDSIGVVAIAVQAVDDAGAPIAGIRPDTLRLDVGRPRFYISAGFQSVPVGETRNLTVMAMDHEGSPHYAAEPVTVALASSDPSIATVQSTVTLPTGTLGQVVQAPFTGVRVGEVRFTASDARTTPPAGPVDRRYASATSEAVQVTLPPLAILSPRNTTRTGVQQEDPGFVVRIANPVASPTTVQVSTNDPNVAVAPATVTIPAGSTVSSEFALTAAAGATAGTQFLVRAAADGFEPAAVVRTIAPGQLVVNNFITTMRMGDSILVRVDVNDPGGSMTRNVTAPQTVTVQQMPSHLYAIAPNTTTPTNTFTIPTGASSVSFYVRATNIGSGSFTVTSPNYLPATSLASTATAVWAYVGLGSGATDPANPTAGFHACGVLVNGRGYCWGDNSSGQLGIGSTTTPAVRPTPLPLTLPFSTDPRTSTGEMGSMHTCGVSPTGQGFCSGRGTEGQLGPASSGSNVSVAIGQFTFSYIAAGDRFTCGVTSSADSTTYCWGTGGGMTATSSQGAMSSTPLQVTGTGGPNGLRFSFISAGLNSVCGITAPGDIYCWGDNARGQLGNGPAYAGNQQIRQVPRQGPVGGTPAIWRTVRVGAEFACGISLTQSSPVLAGRVYCWGRNDFGQAGSTASQTPVAAPTLVGGQQGTVLFYTLAAGTTHACASAISAGSATSQGVWCWGRNNRGQLGNGATGTVSSSMVAVSPSTGGLSTTGLPQGRFYPAIDAGAEATCVVAAFTLSSTAGEAYCWGRNVNGQLALNTSTESNFPRAVRIAEPILDPVAP